jgi:hypothetical protein
MDQKGSITHWRLSLAESLSLAATVAILTLWLTTKFQSKEDAEKLEARVGAVETELTNLRAGMNSIAVDVSYIRGKLENAKFQTGK